MTPKGKEKKEKSTNGIFTKENFLSVLDRG